VQCSFDVLTDLDTGLDTMAVKFDVSWNYSWRLSEAPSNWDAVWVFVKFRRNQGDWQHMTLTNTGYTAPTGATVAIGLRDPMSAYNSSTNRGVGAFIYKSSAGFGTNTFSGAKLIWPYSLDGVQEGDSIDVQLHCLHMVYVPSESFYVGDDNTSTKSFKQQYVNDPVLISSEAAVTVYEDTTPYAVPTAFPKGHNDFYVMRHEIMQEQWRNFFNTLPTTGTPRSNRDITGASGKNSDGLVNRNNLSWDSSVQTNAAALPDNDPPHAANYCTNAMTYLNWADLGAFLDWAGLRPMSELEFEKAARGPSVPVGEEFAWGSTNSTVATSTSNTGRVSEAPSNSGANANWNTGVGGPIRTGAFASLNYSTTSREASGGSYYGAFELSGNVWEQAITVANSEGRSYTGAHGDGVLDSSGLANETNWPSPSTATGSGLRGGSWNVASSNAWVSSRADAATAVTSRASDRGGRGVRTAP
jgi:hypothetical protein